MSKRRKSLLVGLLLLLCMVMQVAMVVPHHHHGGSPVACFDTAHCPDTEIFRHDEQSGCCSEHNHDCEHCCIFRIDIAQFGQHDSDKAFLNAECFSADSFAVGQAVPLCLSCPCRLCSGAESFIGLFISCRYSVYAEDAAPVRGPALV